MAVASAGPYASKSFALQSRQTTMSAAPRHSMLSVPDAFPDTQPTATKILKAKCSEQSNR